jgi:hypothetical protein
MTYSKTHQKFSELLNKPEALTNPAKYLGPNWEDVLNFWIYLDTLSYEENKKMEDRYRALNCDVQISAFYSAWNLADEVVGEEFSNEAWYAAYDVTGGRAVFGNATLELIGSHKLLEQNKTPLALQYSIKP